MKFPKLRDIEAFPIEHEDEVLICFHDPEGYMENEIILTPLAYFVALHLDGETDIGQIQKSFAEQSGGSELSVEDVRKVIDYLEENGLLEGATFEALRRKTLTDFLASDNRPGFLAGRGYPAESAELREFLDGQFTREGGPGPMLIAPVTEPVPKVLIAPHIDLHRGGHSYAQAYRQLQRRKKPKLVFIFGVAHLCPPQPFILTRKHFETPFGALRTNRPIVDRLFDACDWDPFEYEILHRTEHSIEFQTLMLAYLFGPFVEIVPILCGSFAEPGSESDVAESSAPGSVKRVKRFLDECHRIIKDQGDDVLVIAAADLAHVGKRFGDDFEIGEEQIASIEKRDREDLAWAAAGDAEGFYASVMKDENERRVCGLNCIYSALKSAGEAGKGRELHYGYAPDPAGGIVSFASYVFPRHI